MRHQPLNLLTVVVLLIIVTTACKVRGEPLDASEYYAVAWSPEGQWLAVGGSRYLQVYDTQGTALYTQAGLVRDIAWHPTKDGILAATMDNQLVVVDLNTSPKQHTAIPLPSNAPMGWHPTGEQLAWGTASNTVQLSAVIVDKGGALTLQPLRTWTGHAGPVAAMTWNSSGTLLASASGYDRIVNVWRDDTALPILVIELEPYVTHDGDAITLAWLNDTTLAIGTHSATLIADVLSGAITVPHWGYNRVAWAVSVGQVAGLTGRGITVKDLATGDTLHRLDGCQSANNLAWRMNGGALAAVAGRTLCIWNATAWELEAVELP